MNNIGDKRKNDIGLPVVKKKKKERNDREDLSNLRLFRERNLLEQYLTPMRKNVQVNSFFFYFIASRTWTEFVTNHITLDSRLNDRIQLPIYGTTLNFIAIKH